LSLVSVECCKVEVSETDRSPVRSCLTECGVSEGDLETSPMRRPRPTSALQPTAKKCFQDSLLSPVSYVISNKPKQAKFISNLDTQHARNDA